MNQPNFVLIMTDTQGANVVGCYGRPELRTPNIDRLAQEGVLFARAHTTSPVCAPARAALFTGMHAHATGVWGNHLPLGDNIKTMGQRFRDAGYRSALIGKWHLSGHDYFDTGLCPDGWEEQYWYDGRRHLDALSEQEITLWRSGLNSIEDLKRHDIQAEFTWAHRSTERAISFLKDAQKDQPFLLVVSYDEPHAPCTCPPQFAEQFRDFQYACGPGVHDDLRGKPEHHRLWSEHQGQRPSGDHIRRPLYFGCNHFIDWEIGRVLEAVDRFASRDTVVIFTSDHGNMLGSHGMFSKGPNMYEEITRIPLIIRLPGGQQGVRDDALVTHIDILPTMLELAGLPVPPALPGRSLAARLRTGTEEGPQRAAFLEFNRYEVDLDYSGFQPIRCRMEGDYKLVINLLEETDELYDLRHDPAELRNLIASPEHAPDRDRIFDHLMDYMYAVRDPFRGHQWERRPWRQQRRIPWAGVWRPRPADGYAPPARDHDTGLPATHPRKI